MRKLIDDWDNSFIELFTQMTIIFLFVMLVSVVIGIFAVFISNTTSYQSQADAKARCDSLEGSFSGSKCYVNGEEV